MVKKQKKKWNRVHFFQKEKKNDESRKSHPAYIFAQSKDSYKAIIFTHHETTDGKPNVKFQYNIDPTDSKRSSYGVPYRGPRSQKDFQPADKTYRIHKDDYSKLKELKSGKKKK